MKLYRHRQNLLQYDVCVCVCIMLGSFICQQVRAKLSTFGFGGPTEVTCGGNALKFYASVRLNIRRVGFIKKGEEVWLFIFFSTREFETVSR